MNLELKCIQKVHMFLKPFVLYMSCLSVLCDLFICLHLYTFCIVFSLTWPAYMQIYRNKRLRLHKKRVQLPEDWFGTPTWLPLHCFGTPIWPLWCHVKTLYSISHKNVSSVFSLAYRALKKQFSLSPRCFPPGAPVFPSPQKPTFPNSNLTRSQTDKEPLCGCATSKSLFIYLFI